MRFLYCAIASAALAATSADAQLFNFTTLAGSAARGNVDGPAATAQFNSPGSAAMDTNGNLYVADAADDTIRKIAPNGTVITFAGSPGVSGSADGAGTNALFNGPQAVAVDGSGNVYVADTGNFTIRTITPAGAVSTLAGVAGMSGSADGAGTNALFDEPGAIAVDASGNIFVADTWNHTIREISPAGVVETIAGSPGNFGYTNAVGTNALFYEPAGVAVDSSDDVFVADTGNNVIREISSGGAVSIVAGSAGNFGYADADGTNALFDSPRGISLDSSGNLYVADYLNNVIREIVPGGAVATVAGSGTQFGSADGAGTNALFFGPEGVAVNPTNNGLIYVADTGNSTIRELAVSGQNWNVSTLAGEASCGSTNASGPTARFFWPMGIAADGQGNFYVADTANNTIREILANGTTTTIAGSPGMAGSTNGDGTNAWFNAPQGVALDSAGNIYVADTGNSIIRVITPGGMVSTLAGTAGNPGSADGTGGAAQFDAPEGIAVDGTNIFVADTLNHTIREVTSSGVVTTFAGTAGNFGSADGTNGAEFDGPTGMAVDNSGNLFVSDFYNDTIRKITPGGVVSTIAGLPRVFGDADGTDCAARFFEPEGITVDPLGNVYVADAGNQAIRQLTPDGTNWVVSTIAGWAGNPGSADGSGVGARFCYPAGMVMEAGDLVLVDSGNNTMRAGSIITNNPPVIDGQPQSQAVSEGSPAAFSVNATGGPLYYQWQFNGVNLPGATAASYDLSSAQPANAGIYAVIVTSPTGSAVSSNALLTVYAPPTITNQPASQTCLQGATVAFSVGAGPQPLAYQWEENGRPLFNSANVSGATTATLTLSNVTTASSGGYSVLANNGYGFAASSNAVLTVFFVPPPDSPQPYAWWQLNEGAGAFAFDYSGNGHYGTLNSGTSWTAAGHSGDGVYFNATEYSLITINNPFTLAKTTSWTATMWVNRWESRSASTLISGTSDALKLEQYDENSEVGYTYYSHFDEEFPYVTPLNSWVHLAFVGTPSGVTLYTNGVQAAAIANSADSVALNASALGCDDYTVYSDYLDCTLDDVRIYNEVLSQQEIASIYAYGRINPIPFVTLTAPTNGAGYIASTNITLAANVVSNSFSLTGVQFYAGTNLLGQTTTAPYTWTWTNVLMGNYSLTAVALYNGTNNASAPVGISVMPATNAPNVAFSETGSTLQLSWPADHTGWLLQVQTNANTIGLSSNWITVTNSMTTNGMVVPIQTWNGGAFYRLIYP